MGDTGFEIGMNILSSGYFLPKNTSIALFTSLTSVANSTALYLVIGTPFSYSNLAAYLTSNSALASFIFPCFIK